MRTVPQSFAKIRTCRKCGEIGKTGEGCRNGCDLPWDKSDPTLSPGETKVGLDGKPVGSTGFWKVPTTRH